MSAAPGTSARRRAAAVVCALVLAASAGACGDDGDDNAAGGGDVNRGAKASASADDERYCELVAEVDAEAEQVFGDLGEDASAEEQAAAGRELLERVDDELDEMTEVAPAEIADDVKAFVTSTRAELRGEAVERTDDSEIVAWEDQHCA